MKASYRPPEHNEEVNALAEKVLGLLVTSGVTYQQADDALTVAQEMLATKTTPVIS